MDLMSHRRILLAQSAQESGVLATATGNPMTFTTDLVRWLHSLVIPFTPIQAAGTPSPDNPLPISGWTGASVYNETAYNASATPKLTINWQTEAGTIYGGTVTLNEDGSADVASAWVKHTFNGSEAWYLSTYNRAYLRIPEVTIGTISIAYGIISDKLQPIRATSISNNTNYVCFFGGESAVGIRLTADYDLAGIKNWMSENGLEVAVQLAEPQTYHLDNIGTLMTYLGTNTIWTDTNGTNTAEYWIKNT